MKRGVIVLGILILAVLTAYLLYRYNYRHEMSLMIVDRDFHGTGFILFNQSNADEIPMSENIRVLKVKGKENFIRITSTSHVDFMGNSFFLVEDSVNSFPIEKYNNLTKRRIFEFNLDSIAIKSKKHLYYCSFFVIPNKSLVKFNDIKVASEQHRVTIDSIIDVVLKKYNSTETTPRNL